ncbi:hypothetical protein B0J11DRAFT_602278, partial [Dendryphion nanum]
MILPLSLLVLVPWAQAALHHIFVGTVDGSSIYTIEFDDTYKTLNVIRNDSAAGATPSIVIEGTKQFLFSSRPSDGTISRYEIGQDYSLKGDGSLEIPSSCNSTSYRTIHILPSIQHYDAIYGAATNTLCSTIFAFSTSGHYTQNSAAVPGDVHSLTFSPSGAHLHALNTASPSILTFTISLDDPNLTALSDTSVLPNTTFPAQIIAHPAGTRVYVVTRDSNELLSIPVDPVSANPIPGKGGIDLSRHAILPTAPSPDTFHTTALALGLSNTTLWTLTSSPSQQSATITVFTLDPVSGAVGKKIARAAFSTRGGKVTGRGGMEVTITAMPWRVGGVGGTGGTGEEDLVVVTTWPGGVVAVLGVER